MNQNQMNMGNGYSMPGQNQGNQGLKLEIPQENKKIFIGFLICIAVIVIGCFLPYAVQKASDISINYISYEGDIKDGVYLIALGIVAIALLFKRKYLTSLILQGISTVIFVIDWLDMADRMDQVNGYAGLLGDSYKIQYGIGFWLVLVGIVGSLITAFLLWKSNKGNATSNMTQPMMDQGMNNMNTMNNMNSMNNVNPTVTPTTCPYCGTPKAPNSQFCPNCGAKS